MKTKLMALEALKLYDKAGYGNSTDHSAQGMAYDAAIKAIAALEADIANPKEIEASGAKNWNPSTSTGPVPILYTDLINGKQVLRDDLWLATTGQLKSVADIAKPVEPVSLSIVTALRFYANGSHLHIDGDHHDFDTVSGEPDNLLFSGKDDDETMLEDGGIARQALRGKPILWVDGDDDETPKPIDGEAIHTNPQEPAAIPTDLLRVLADFEQYDEEADEFAYLPTTGRIQAAANKARVMLAAAPGGAA